MSNTYETSVELDSGEINVTVEYDIEPGQELIIHRPPEECQEGFPASICDLYVLHNDKDITDQLDASQIDHIESQIWDDLNQQVADVQYEDSRY